MANTRIILNRQSDLKLTGAEILEPIGIIEGDIAGLVAHFEAVEASISTEISDRGVAIAAEESLRIAGDTSLETKVNADVSTEKAAREAADASLESKVSTEKGRIDAILEASDADKDSFAEIVTLINSVDTENDQAFASYVLSNDAALSSEESSRIAADLAEQNARIAGDAAVTAAYEAVFSVEASTREDADSSLDVKIDGVISAHIEDTQEIHDLISNEESSRIAGDTSLESELSSEISKEKAAREGTLSAEESARIAGDASLELRLSIEESTHAVEYSTEVAAREAADASLEGKVNADISTEKAAREAGDASLEAKVSTEKDRIDAILLASDADKDSFAEIVTLINSVDTENDQAFASYVLSNNAAVSTEVAAREAADTSLETSIQEVDGARKDGEESLEELIGSEMKQEIAAREDADSSLETVIDAEASTRELIDEAIKAGVNTALTEIKNMIIHASREFTFRPIQEGTGDGVITTFTAPVYGSPAVYLNGLLQMEGQDYEVNGSVDGKGNPSVDCIFNTAPDNGSMIMIWGQVSQLHDDNAFPNATPLV